MERVKNWDDAIREGRARAYGHVAGYFTEGEGTIYDPRVNAVVDRAIRILNAAEAPLVVVGDVIDIVAFSEVARILHNQPSLTTLDIIDIIRDVWIRVKDWMVND